MTDHSPNPPTENSDHRRNAPLISNLTQWSRGEILSLCALILTLLSFLFGPGALKQFSLSNTDNKAALVAGNGIAHNEGIISIVNVVLACIVLVDIRLKRLEFLQAKQSISQLAETSLAQFLRGWFWVWTTWAMLYFWLALVWLVPLYVNHPIWPWIVADFLNMLNGCLMFCLFLVLDLPSSKTSTEPFRDLPFKKNIKTIFSVGFLLFVVETITIILRQRPSSMNSPDVLLKNLIAVFTAVGMAFFIGRLDSHYLKVPRIVLAPLYLYVIIQLSWNNIAGSQASADDPTRTIILGLACFLKFLLFWVIRSWLVDGSIVRYLEAAEQHSSSQR